MESVVFSWCFYVVAFKWGRGEKRLKWSLWWGGCDVVVWISTLQFKIWVVCLAKTIKPIHWLKYVSFYYWIIFGRSPIPHQTASCPSFLLVHKFVFHAQIDRFVHSKCHPENHVMLFLQIFVYGNYEKKKVKNEWAWKNVKKHEEIEKWQTCCCWDCWCRWSCNCNFVVVVVDHRMLKSSLETTFCCCLWIDERVHLTWTTNCLGPNWTIKMTYYRR